MILVITAAAIYDEGVVIGKVGGRGETGFPPENCGNDRWWVTFGYDKGDMDSGQEIAGMTGGGTQDFSLRSK